MKNGNFILGVIVGILVMAIIGASFYLGTKFANKEDKKEETKEVEKKEDPSVFKDLSLDDSLVKEARMFNPSGFCGGQVYEFTKKNVSVDDLSAEFKMNVLFDRYGSEIIALTDTGKSYEVDDSDFGRYFKDLSFLDKYKNGKDITPAIPAVGKYKNGKYVFTPYATGCIGVHEGYETQLDSARKNDKQLILNYVYYYVEHDYEKDVTSIYYKENDAKPTEENVKFDTDTYEYKLDSKLYDHYEFVFDITDNHMYLEEIVYVPKK